MIIKRARYVPSRDVSQFAWSRLRRFHNVEIVTEVIRELHHLPANQLQNAKRQAEQVRHCLVQASEYFTAGERVSLATRPTLYYYGLLSLALAEVLLKQDGDSRLERLRERHRHHGLMFQSGIPRRDHPGLEEAAALLRAKPHVGVDGERVGTFEVWHRSCRHMPLVAHGTTKTSEGQYFDIAVVAEPQDQTLGALPNEGTSLLDALARLPGMYHYLEAWDANPATIRSFPANAMIDEVSGTERIQVQFLPRDRPTFETFRLGWHLQGVEHQFRDSVLQWSWQRQPNQHQGTLPPSSAMNRAEWYFWLGEEPLNEFGFFFVALFILGNFARYHPDQWMVDVEKASPLALATEALLDQAALRVPLLALSEMDRVCYVPPSSV